MALRLRYNDTSITLAAGQIVVGRSVECDLVVNDPLASRRHAVITTGKTGAFVSDLGSKAGVLVNGAAIAGSHRLATGDTIQLAGVRIEVDDVDGPEEPADPKLRTTLSPPANSTAPAGFRLAPTPPLGLSRVERLRPGEVLDHAGLLEEGEELTRTHEAPRVALPPDVARIARPAPLPSFARPDNLRALATLAEKAFALNRPEEAERILQRALLDTVAAARRGEVDGPGAELAATLAARLASALGAGRWFDVAVEIHAARAEIPPGPVIDLLMTAARKAKPIDKNAFRKYLAGVRSSAGDSPARRFLLQRLEGVQRTLDLK